MERYNSDKKKETDDKKIVEKVVNGVVKTRKKTGFNKALSLLLDEDIVDPHTYIVDEVIIPGVKNTITSIIDIISDSFKTMLTGSNSRRSSTATKYNYSTSYNKPLTRASTRNVYSYDDIVVATRGEAEAVLDAMEDLIDRYKMASVADLYELVGIKSEYTDNKYGWFDLKRASWSRVGNDYILNLPKAVPLD